MESTPRILLSSVFGPFGVDDAYGRKENIIELFHNQVTREQGLFSLRFHHRSFGLYFLAENIEAPTVVLDFPSEKRFIREIKKGYDYVGISFIVPNFIKAKRMAELIREHAPETKIILGGHGTRTPDIDKLIDYDHLCTGEGVVWLRKLLGENPDRPFSHPAIPAAFERRVVGVPLKSDGAVLIPGVGCPNACRFCCTSHFFDKKYTPFFETGKQLFEQCVELEKHGYDEFFVMDENFLKYPERAKELLALMEKHKKPFRFGIFSSAETVALVGAEFMARLGVVFLWLGVESKYEMYEKNKGLDLKSIIGELRDFGISVLASGILFLEQHDKNTIWEDIRFVVDMESDMVQFMQLGPFPGTKLFTDYEETGLIRKDIPYEEWHGQHRLWFDHPNFTLEESEDFLRQAFQYDYDTQGSSLLRICDTLARGYNRLKGYDDFLMVQRRRYMKDCARRYRPALEVLDRFAHNDRARELARLMTAKYAETFGPKTLALRVEGKLALATAAIEKVRCAPGRTPYQPGALRTKYRMSVKERMVQQIKGRTRGNQLGFEFVFGQSPALLKLSGAMDSVNSQSLLRKVSAYLKSEENDLILVLDRLSSVEDQALARLLERIQEDHGRVKVAFREGSAVIRAAVAGLPEELRQLVVEFQPNPA
jgi:radical SAM superfamily enzyme YgiQ (UPF0313 family)